MPIVHTQQGMMFYTQRGNKALPKKPTLVCIHGAGGTHQHWVLHQNRLSHDASVIACDLPGHGRSPGPGRNTIAAYSDILCALLDSLGLERAIIAGHSMGGAIALTLALTAPHRVQGLVLANTGARLPVLPDLFEHINQGNLSAAVRIIVDRAYGNTTLPSMRAAGEATFLRNNARVLYDDLQACAGFDVRERLHEIHCPTLLIGSNDDNITPIKFSHTLHHAIAGSSLVMVPEAGHMALIEQPDVVTMALRQFLYLVQQQS